MGGRQSGILRWLGILVLLAALLAGGTGTTLAANNRIQIARARGQSTVLAWGANYVGELGTGSATTSGCFCAPTSQAINLPGLQDGETVGALATGYDFSLALTSRGRVFSWGSNVFGQLGNGRSDPCCITPNPTPQAISLPGLQAGEAVSALAAGWDFSLALTNQGRVFSWGSNVFGQLGNGRSDPSYPPVPHPTPQAISLPGLQAGEAVSALGAGFDFSLALTNLGRVFSWGDNFFGQLGDGSSDPCCFDTAHPTPQAISLPELQAGEVFSTLSAGAYHSLALSNRGRVFSWGNNFFGQLGNGSIDPLYPIVPHPTPQAISLPGLQAGETVSALAAGWYFSLALTNLGRVFSWGDNNAGQLGNGSSDYISRPTPQAITLPGLQDREAVTTLAAGAAHSLTLTNLGRVFAWGANFDGQLGTGSSDGNAHPTPQAISLAGLTPGQTVTAIFTGNEANHSFALAGAPLPPLVVDGTRLTARVGRPLQDAVVGSFADAGTHTAADFRAFVDWGDSPIGGLSSAAIQRPAHPAAGQAPRDGTVLQLYLITDSHTYDEAGTYPVNVTIVAADGRTAHLTSVAQVGR